MGYPHGDTYLERIQASEYERRHIREAYYVLAHKYCRENDKEDIELSIKESFAILGEAFESESYVVNGIIDAYHFMWDVLDELLKERATKDDNSTNNLDKED